MAAKGRFRTNFEYWLARAVLGFFSALPLSLAISVSRALARLGFRFPKLRRVGERNLQLAFPELSVEERRQLLRGCFENLGRLLVLFSYLQRDSRHSLDWLIKCEGIERIDEALRHGRGLLVLTGHLGAWELVNFGFSLIDRPGSFLVRRIDNPKIEALIDRARTRLGNRTIDKRSAARDMLQVLRAGGLLGILVDLNTQEKEGIFVDFFGVPASTTSVVAKLALRTEAQVLPVFAPWDTDRKRVVLTIGEPISIERTGDEAEDVRRLTQLFTSVVENYVRRYPDQWLWIHRRWKTRPAGDTPIYQ